MADTDSQSPNTLSLAFAETLYASYLRDPNSVPSDWRAYFASLGPDGEFARSPQIGPSFRAPSIFSPASSNGAAARESTDNGAVRTVNAPTRSLTPAGGMHALGSIRPATGVSDEAVRQDRVDQLIRAYRVRGHMIAKLDPLGLPRPEMPELDMSFYGLLEADLDRKFSSRTIHGTETLTLREMIRRLETTYCRSIGVEFMHIHDLEVKNWLQERMEGTGNRLKLKRDEQVRILTKLTDAVIFEEFVQKKYLGAKSFSLEGTETLIPLLDLAIERSAELGVDEIVLGMAHRGRLNVLANILGKSPRLIFREFEDKDPELYRGSGDVKYHMGYSSDFVTTTGRRVHLSLCFNPSHLEFVSPVVLGRVRAKQERARDANRERKLGIIIHGDAAFAGEGIVQETLNLSQLRAYRTGGTIHVIVNNQIGFTTPPSEARSNTYATDVAKMLQIPIFHVNGEDPEAVAQVVQLATEFRAAFKRDIVIDMYGYRRHGHNEGDEPAFTQPVLYRAIAERSSVRQGYLEHLEGKGISREEADHIAVERRAHLEQELGEARKTEARFNMFNWLGGYWEGYHGGPDTTVPEVDTAVDRDHLSIFLRKLTEVPDHFHPHKKIERLLQQRREMAEGKRPLDWASAELVAYASLAASGTRIRMTGQDVGRGTFSQRHAVLADVEDGHSYVPLTRIASDQAPVEIYNSPLSEAGVLGFEYGYSLDWPDGLIVWEAQFGDFCNAAQVIIDQFLSSAEDKWKRLSGLVMLLPHGFEGMGPEHSSARMERFLMLAAEDNMQITQPTTPAQHFHMLRRQVLRPWRKPLVVFTPKSLLRNPKATSSIEDCASGRFHRILADPNGKTQGIRHVMLCSGKVFYELDKERAQRGRDDVAILRLEQLYPLSDRELAAALDPFGPVPVTWVQEEPENMGPWRYIYCRFGEKLLGRHPLTCAARDASASPATGSASSHRLEQEELMNRAFGD